MKILEHILDKDIFLMYKDGKSVSSISRLYNCDRRTIVRYLKKYNEYVPELKPRQKTKIDSNQLKNLTKEMSYILGLIWTDGYMTDKNGYAVGVKILKSDLSEVKFVFDAIGQYSYHDIKIKNRREAASAAFFSKEFYNFLFKLDFKNKSKAS